MEEFNVFLLDDEPVICEVLMKEIRKRKSLNPTITTVPEGTGSAALRVLKSMSEEDKEPDLSIIDLRLNNGLTGFDVIDKIIELFGKKSHKIVILTGSWEGSEDWERAMKYLAEDKVDEVLGKWGLGQVLSNIKKFLNRIEVGKETV